MFGRRTPICVTLVTAIMAACASDQVRTSSYVHPTYQWTNFTTYHQRRDTLVEVHGRLFGLDRRAFEEAVTARMQGQHAGPPTRFTTRPGPSAEKGLRVIMAFDAKPVGGGLCSAKAFEPGDYGPETALVAAWCWEDRADSEVWAWVSGLQGPDDPRFRRLVGETTMDLFPPRGERRYEDRDRDRDRMRRSRTKGNRDKYDKSSKK